MSMIKKQYFYPSMYDNGDIFTYIDKDGYGRNINGFSNLLDRPILYSHHNHVACYVIYLDGSISYLNDPEALYYPNEKVVWISGRKMDKKYLMMTYNTINNKCYYLFNDLGEGDKYRCWSDQVVGSIYEVNLNELPSGDRDLYKSIWTMCGLLFMTMKGNLYFKPYLVDGVEQPLHKVNTSNISDVLHMTGYHNLFLTKDHHIVYGNAISSGNSHIYQVNPDPICTDFLYCGGSNNRDSNKFRIVKDNPKEFTILSNDGIEIASYEFEDNIDSIWYQGESMVLLENGDAYYMSMKLDNTTDSYYVTAKKCMTIDMSTYRGRYYVFEHPTYITLDIDAYSYEYNPSKTNIKYKYRFALHQNISNDGTRNVVNYVTSKKWAPCGVWD